MNDLFSRLVSQATKEEESLEGVDPDDGHRETAFLRRQYVARSSVQTGLRRVRPDEHDECHGRFLL